LFQSDRFLVYAQAIVAPTTALANNNITGSVTFSQVGDGNVTVTVLLSGVFPADSLHGIHVHWFGDLGNLTDGNSAGGHYNPTGANHSCPENSSMRHYGDMGNWQAVGGVINQTKVLDLLHLSGSTSIIGRALVVHQAADDCVSNPAGASGTRIGLGVIGIVNSTLYGGSGEAINNAGNAMSAIVHLQPASGTNVSGIVYLYQPTPTSATTVWAAVTGITGPHGFHLHWWGDISKADGTATGAHYNPNSSLHGVPPFAQRHIGDMGIISYNVGGISLYQYENNYISLNGINNVLGRAVHVHQNSDDCSNPVGTGGARWAQGVVGITNSSAFVMPAFPVGVPTTQNGQAICSAIYTQSAVSSGSNSNTATNTATTTMSMSMSGSSATNTVSNTVSRTVTQPASGVERLTAYFLVVAVAIAMLF